MVLKQIQILHLIFLISIINNINGGENGGNIRHGNNHIYKSKEEAEEEGSHKQKNGDYLTFELQPTSFIPLLEQLNDYNNNIILHDDDEENDDEKRRRLLGDGHHSLFKSSLSSILSFHISNNILENKLNLGVYSSTIEIPPITMHDIFKDDDDMKEIQHQQQQQQQQHGSRRLSYQNYASTPNNDSTTTNNNNKTNNDSSSSFKIKYNNNSKNLLRFEKQIQHLEKINIIIKSHNELSINYDIIRNYGYSRYEWMERKMRRRLRWKRIVENDDIVIHNNNNDDDDSSYVYGMYDEGINNGTIITEVGHDYHHQKQQQQRRLQENVDNNSNRNHKRQQQKVVLSKLLQRKRSLQSIITPTFTTTKEGFPDQQQQQQQQQQQAPPPPIPLSQGFGTHYATIWVGSPTPQRKSVIVDTGSHHTSFPCGGCIKCGEKHHTDKYFDPSLSKSFKTVDCNHCTWGATCTKLNLEGSYSFSSSSQKSKETMKQEIDSINKEGYGRGWLDDVRENSDGTLFQVVKNKFSKNTNRETTASSSSSTVRMTTSSSATAQDYGAYEERSSYTPPTEGCVFTQSYAEGSSWSAYQSYDLLFPGGTSILDAADPQHAKLSTNYPFGCGLSATGLFVTQLADGIVGLGKHDASMGHVLFKAKSIRHGNFGLCFRREMIANGQLGVTAGMMTLGIDGDNPPQAVVKKETKMMNKRKMNYEEDDRDIKQAMRKEDTSSTTATTTTTSTSTSDEYYRWVKTIDTMTGWYVIRVNNIFLRAGGERSVGIGGITTGQTISTQTIARIPIDIPRLNGGKGVILDSGTTDTFLHVSALKGFEEAWKGITGMDYTNEPVRMNRDMMESLPTVLIQIEAWGGKSSARYNRKGDWRGGMIGSLLLGSKTSPSNYGRVGPMLDPKRPDDILIAVPAIHYMEYSPSKGVYMSRLYFTETKGGVLGANIMQGHDVLFDFENKRVGFAESSCEFVPAYSSRDGGIGGIDDVGGGDRNGNGGFLPDIISENNDSDGNSPDFLETTRNGGSTVGDITQMERDGMTSGSFEQDRKWQEQDAMSTTTEEENNECMLALPMLASTCAESIDKKRCIGSTSNLLSSLIIKVTGMERWISVVTTTPRSSGSSSSGISDGDSASPLWKDICKDTLLHQIMNADVDDGISGADTYDGKNKGIVDVAPSGDLVTSATCDDAGICTATVTCETTCDEVYAMEQQNKQKQLNQEQEKEQDQQQEQQRQSLPRNDGELSSALCNRPTWGACTPFCLQSRTFGQYRPRIEGIVRNNEEQQFRRLQQQQQRKKIWLKQQHHGKDGTESDNAGKTKMNNILHRKGENECIEDEALRERRSCHIDACGRRADPCLVPFIVSAVLVLKGADPSKWDEESDELLAEALAIKVTMRSSDNAGRNVDEGGGEGYDKTNKVGEEKEYVSNGMLFGAGDVKIVMIGPWYGDSNNNIESNNESSENVDEPMEDTIMFGVDREETVIAGEGMSLPSGIRVVLEISIYDEEAEAAMEFDVGDRHGDIKNKKGNLFGKLPSFISTWMSTKGEKSTVVACRGSTDHYHLARRARAVHRGLQFDKALQWGIDEMRREGRIRGGEGDIGSMAFMIDSWTVHTADGGDVYNHDLDPYLGPLSVFLFVGVYMREMTMIRLCTFVVLVAFIMYNAKRRGDNRESKMGITGKRVGEVCGKSRELVGKCANMFSRRTCPRPRGHDMGRTAGQGGRLYIGGSGVILGNDNRKYNDNQWIDGKEEENESGLLRRRWWMREPSTEETEWLSHTDIDKNGSIARVGVMSIADKRMHSSLGIEITSVSSSIGLSKSEFGTNYCEKRKCNPRIESIISN